MVDETKKETTQGAKPQQKNVVAVLLKVCIGLSLLVLGGLSILKWWPELLILVRGFIGLFLVLAGIITLAIAKE